MLKQDSTMNAKEKELIGGIQRFSTEDGPGIRTTVFFNGGPAALQVVS